MCDIRIFTLERTFCYGLTADFFNLLAHANSIIGILAEIGFRNAKVQYNISPLGARMASIVHDVAN